MRHLSPQRGGRRVAAFLTAATLVLSGIALGGPAALAVEAPEAVAEQDLDPGIDGGDGTAQNSPDTTPAEEGVDLTDPPAHPTQWPDNIAPEISTVLPAPPTTTTTTTTTTPQQSAPATSSAPAPVTNAVKPRKKATSVKVTSRSKSNVTVGKKVYVKGKTSKSLKGKRVSLQIKVGKRWNTVATAKVQADRTFKLSAKATKAGKQRYRVAHPSTRTTKTSVSTSFTYTVWKWYSVINLGQVASEGFYLTNSGQEATLRGVRYTRSLVNMSEDGGTAFYNVNGKCTKFKATVGIDDDSANGATRSFALRSDDIRTHLTTTSVGNPVKVTGEVKGAFRMGLELGTRLDDRSGYSYGVFGNPQVFCSKAP